MFTRLNQIKITLNIYTAGRVKWWHTIHWIVLIGCDFEIGIYIAWNEAIVETGHYTCTLQNLLDGNLSGVHTDNKFVQSTVET